MNDGAISEMVKEGGIVCNDVDAMITAVKEVHRVKPKALEKTQKDSQKKLWQRTT